MLYRPSPYYDAVIAAIKRLDEQLEAAQSAQSMVKKKNRRKMRKK